VEIGVDEDVDGGVPVVGLQLLGVLNRADDPVVQPDREDGYFFVFAELPPQLLQIVVASAAPALDDGRLVDDLQQKR
jgi:hypothetical protein